jgi:heme/copper-type cytochrome/quinol oxidase subunit 4
VACLAAYGDGAKIGGIPEKWFDTPEVLFLFAALVIVFYAIGTYHLYQKRQRSAVVERELMQTLGVQPPPTRSEGSDPEIDAVKKDESCDSAEGDEHRSPALKDGLTEPISEGPRNQDHQPSQSVVVNFNGGMSATRLTEVLRENSDGQARLVIKYYTQGYSQASVSFALSMIFAIVGFVVVAIAVVGYIRNPEHLAGAVVTGVVGAVNEVVGFLFFKRADKGRELMMELVDRLRDDREKDRQFIGAMGILDQVDNSVIKDTLRSAILLQFSGATTSLSEIADLAESKVFSDARRNEPTININGPVVNSRKLEGDDSSARTRVNPPS